MRAYLPMIYGGLSALFVLRGMARGLFGTEVQAYYNQAFAGTATSSGETGQS